MSEYKKRRIKIRNRWFVSFEYAPRVLDFILQITVWLRLFYCTLAEYTNKRRLFSDEGRSFSFDNRGTGYGRGEGCGILVLKPLDQALKDGDSIRSVILNSGINQDGKTPGITMPNGAAQGMSTSSCISAELKGGRADEL